MRKICLLKQGLAVLLSLSMGLGPCAPGSFAAFAETSAVEAGMEEKAENTDADDEESSNSGTEGDTAPAESSENEDAAPAESSESKDTAPEEEETADGGDSEETSDGDSGETGDGSGEEGSDSGSAAGSGEDSETDGQKEDLEDTSGDSVSGTDGSTDTEVTEAETGSGSEDAETSTAAETAGEGGSAPSDENEETVPSEENVPSDEAVSLDETVPGEVETKTAPEDVEIEPEAEFTENAVKSERRVLQEEVDGTNISVIYDDGVFPENVTLEVHKVEEDSEEQEEIRENVENAAGEESTGFFLSAFKIRVLDENKDEVEPDIEKGEAFVRFEEIPMPDEEDAAFGIDDIKMFVLEDGAGGRIRELETVDRLNAGEVSMMAEGAVVDDVSGREETKKEDYNEKSERIAVIGKISRLGMFILAIDAGTEELLRQDPLLVEYSLIYWGIDSEYKLTFSPVPLEDCSVAGGSFADINSYSYYLPPWHDYHEQIRSIVVEDSEGQKIAPLYLSNWFYECENAESIDLSGLDSSRAKDMGGVFYGCSSLQELDLSSFETSSTDNMFQMFYGCSSLKELDLSCFDTSNAISMERMFSHCSSLTSLNIESFDTRNVQYMGEMFLNCSSLTSIDTPVLDTANVVDMFGMFRGCKSLESLDLSAFQTGNVKNMKWMFLECGKLTALDLSAFETGQVTNMGGMFQSCFGLKSLDLTAFVTDKVTDMNSMFYGCSDLASLDLSSFDTRSVTNMSSMFYHCISLPGLDLTSFDTGAVEDMSTMFYGCDILSRIWAGPEWSTEKVNTEQVLPMFAHCTRLKGDKGTAYDPARTGVEYACLDGGEEKPGYLSRKTDSTEVIYWGIRSDGELRISSEFLEGDFLKSGTLTGEQYTSSDNGGASTTLSKECPWAFNKNITTVRIGGEGDIVRPTFTTKWFAGLSNVTEIDLQYLDTSYVTKMDKMFYFSSNLKTLELSSFDTSRVTDMSSMFERCSALTELDLKSFITANVTDMSGMFKECGLTTLDISGFDTGSVTSMKEMFCECSSLTEIKLGSMQAEHLVSMEGMFSDCSSLETVDLSDSNLPALETVEYIFNNCDSLKTVSFRNANVEKLTSLYCMFHYLKALRSVDLTNMNTQNVTNMEGLFCECSSLTDIRLSGLNTSKVITMKDMFFGCRQMDVLDLRDFDTTEVTDMECMFEWCTGLQYILAGHGWSTDNVTEPEEMFGGCEKLIGGAGTLYYYELTSTEYAHVDEGIDNPGYLTAAPEEGSKPVTGVRLDKTSISVSTGTEYTLRAEVIPEDAGLKLLFWSSSDPAVLSVDQFGRCSANTEGSGEITVTTVDGRYSAACTFTVTAPTDPKEDFIRRLYVTCMGREADAGGLNHWLGLINSGRIQGIALAGAFVFSKEFTGKNYCNEHFVRQIYPALMGRDPDSGGLAYWVSVLDKGTTREALLNQFASSAEYRNLCEAAGFELGPKIDEPEYGTQQYGPCAVCGSKSKVVQFVERMYTECMKRSADDGGLAFWSKGLYEHTFTGKTVLYNFFLSSEIKNMGLANQEYVRRIYKTMLDRDPDDDGLNYWTRRLDTGDSPKAVINGFIDSSEFTKICNDYGIVRK